jgi:GntR family transcriptional regulator
MFALDAKDPTPLYAQLERAVCAAIATGRLRPGERLPTVRQLAVELRINANTVARVYAALERAGVVETCRGVGTFVCDRRSNAAAHPDGRRQLARLADRYLGEAVALGFSAEEAIDLLKTRVQDTQGESSDA